MVATDRSERPPKKGALPESRLSPSSSAHRFEWMPASTRIRAAVRAWSVDLDFARAVLVVASEACSRKVVGFVHGHLSTRAVASRNHDDEASQRRPSRGGDDLADERRRVCRRTVELDREWAARRIGTAQVVGASIRARSMAYSCRRYSPTDLHPLVRSLHPTVPRRGGVGNTT